MAKGRRLKGRTLRGVKFLPWISKPLKVKSPVCERKNENPYNLSITYTRMCERKELKMNIGVNFNWKDISNILGGWIQGHSGCYNYCEPHGEDATKQRTLQESPFCICSDKGCDFAQSITCPFDEAGWKTPWLFQAMAYTRHFLMWVCAQPFGLVRKG